jgi:hypothetical protein
MTAISLDKILVEGVTDIKIGYGTSGVDKSREHFCEHYYVNVVTHPGSENGRDGLWSSSLNEPL